MAIAALKFAHTARDLPFDSRDRRLQKVLQGIKREKAELPNQSAALHAHQLLAILEGLGDDPIAVRDAAILALGFAAARRRSEIVGLDLDALGSGDGVLTQSATEFRLVLVRGKTVIENEDPILINRDDNREAARALDRWIELADVRPGEPIFRSIRRGGHITCDRLSASKVARIVKQRLIDHLIKGGVPSSLADAEARKFAAHSLRHGFASTAAEAGASTLEIASVTGHRSQAILARYVRQAEKNAIRPSRRAGVGLRRL